MCKRTEIEIPQELGDRLASWAMFLMEPRDYQLQAALAHSSGTERSND